MPETRYKLTEEELTELQDLGTAKRTFMHAMAGIDIAQQSLGLRITQRVKLMKMPETVERSVRLDLKTGEMIVTDATKIIVPGGKRK
jgi:hypothetical protein